MLCEPKICVSKTTKNWVFVNPNLVKTWTKARNGLQIYVQKCNPGADFVQYFDQTQYFFFKYIKYYI